MKASAKWFAAGGTLLLVIGFMLPVITISNSEMQSSISLMQMAGVSYWFFLYLFPLLAVVILLFTLLPATDQTTKLVFAVGQIGGLVVSALLLLGTLVYLVIQPQQLMDPSSLGILLDSQLHSQNVSIWPGIGFFILVFGFGFVVFGAFANLPLTQKKQTKPAETQNLQPDNRPSQAEDVTSVSIGAHLEGTKGSMAGKKIIINGEDFSIGRSRDNDLQLADKKISRLHTRIRYSQGSWFIQDQNSRLGTDVNGKMVAATRLQSGDRIKIGDEVFTFHLDNKQ